ncbi:DUF1642 domain-containing protein [Lactococcus lactis]|uniref:DUF1642 domain-containing protein n=1 Tax=Lactococcus lactis TaxID=1358 RepID=UPI00070D9D9C|nr:DUF1642 domain-containing protein [Lactococcus lactis]KRO22321.1 hypothetical protein IV65_GL000740 [Lactococcus lactis subsp. lactis]
MTKFEEEFNYLIELSGKVLIGQVDAEAFEKNRIAFFEKYETDQQQALPVVPSFVAEWIECVKGKDNNATALLTDFDNMPDDVNEWLFFQRHDKNINLILRAWLDGYTVEKPQLFYLKNKLTTSYLILDTSTGYFEHWSSTEATGRYKSSFTQSEINSMQTGSYELVPVEDGE